MRRYERYRLKAGVIPPFVTEKILELFHPYRLKNRKPRMNRFQRAFFDRRKNKNGGTPNFREPTHEYITERTLWAWIPICEFFEEVSMKYFFAVFAVDLCVAASVFLFICTLSKLKWQLVKEGPDGRCRCCGSTDVM